MPDIKTKIFKLLQNRGEMFTAEIADELKISTTTASKYLGILEGEGKLKSYWKKPYKNWSLNENGEKND